ncbi:MAG: cell division protein FtsQ/DivIB [Lachnospiraceae bacterium]|nr:cell division protein FtsQ/DivIB [Lachnospiraceae bacterium]MBQ3666324.1 cell division protein FtsQ/DivIB [Lachnospiraceae bacterium]
MISNSGKTKIKVFLILVILLIILGFIFAMQRIDDNDIVVEGNKKYSKEEMMHYIFTSDWDKNPYVLYVKTKRGKTKQIPFVDKYDVSITGFNNVTITVYEKKIIGYVNYMGNNMYFDKDGTVVESSTEIIDGIPKVTGLEFENIILEEKLPVEDERVFALILDTTQALLKYEVSVDKIYISKDREVTLYMDQIDVLLGDGQDMDDKVRTVSDMMPNLSGLKGVLDIKEYSEQKNGYTFKKDAGD